MPKMTRYRSAPQERFGIAGFLTANGGGSSACEAEGGEAIFSVNWRSSFRSSFGSVVVVTQFG
jgi:hypothetical protein